MISNKPFKGWTNKVTIVYINKEIEHFYTDNETSSKNIFYKLVATQEIIQNENEQWWIRREQILEIYTGPASVG